MDVRAADYQTLFSIPGQPSAVAYYLSREAYFWIDERKTLQMFVIGERNITSLYPGKRVLYNLIQGSIYFRMYSNNLRLAICKTFFFCIDNAAL